MKYLEEDALSLKEHSTFCTKLDLVERQETRNGYERIVDTSENFFDHIIL